MEEKMENLIEHIKIKKLFVVVLKQLLSLKPISILPLS
jgi:hypothetical protein